MAPSADAIRRAAPALLAMVARLRAAEASKSAVRPDVVGIPVGTDGDLDALDGAA